MVHRNNLKCNFLWPHSFISNFSGKADQVTIQEAWGMAEMKISWERPGTDMILPGDPSLVSHAASWALPFWGYCADLAADPCHSLPSLSSPRKPVSEVRGCSGNERLCGLQAGSCGCDQANGYLMCQGVSSQWGGGAVTYVVSFPLTPFNFF